MRMVAGAVTGVVIAAGLTILIIWLVIHPHKPRYYVNHASVSHFSLTPDGLVSANLHFDMATRNPNRKIAIYYYRMQAFLLYGSDQIGWATLPMFYQGHKNTTFLQTNVAGQGVPLKSGSAEDLKLEQTAGTLDLDLKLYARLRFKVGSWKSKRYTMRVHCQHVTVSVKGAAFKPMRCKVHV